MNIFSRSFRVAKCISALNSDNIKLARHHFDKSDVDDLSNPRIVALGARISMLENDTRSALPQLTRALALAEVKSSEKARYVAHYCRYFLELIKRSDCHEEHRLMAMQLDPGELCLDTLPLPRDEITLAEVDRMNKGDNSTVH